MKRQPLRLSVIVLSTVLLTAVVLAGWHLSAALDQIGAIRAPEMPVAAAGRQPADGESPPPDSKDGPAMAAEGRRAPSVDEASPLAMLGEDNLFGEGDPSIDVPVAEGFDEQELLLEYFGHEVSLNDFGELAEPDPEFERAIRALANEHGEILAED